MLIATRRHVLGAAFALAPSLPNDVRAQVRDGRDLRSKTLQQTNILIVLTSTSTMGDDPKPTGLWFEEMSTPYYVFRQAGTSVTLASIKGGEPPVDPHSLKAKGENEASVERFLADAEAAAALKITRPITAVAAQDFDAVFLSGGHGAMWDFATSDVLAALLGRAWADGKVVAAVCHGPAGLVNVKDPQGVPIVRGRRVAGFSDSEEHAMRLETTVPFLLETRLRELGGRYESGPDFQPFAVADGRLVTGQNPPSSARTAELVLEALQARA